MKKLTPVLVVDAIEPCLELWEGRLGFSRRAEVPEGDHLGFVILAKDEVEIMYQSRASLAKDLPAVHSLPQGASFLYVEVGDLESILSRLEGLDPLVPRRKTFYGADEIVIREPGGHVVTFAQFGA